MMTIPHTKRRVAPHQTIHISTEDAMRLAPVDGEPLRLRSCHGEALLPDRINPVVKSDELFAIFHTARVLMYCRTSSGHDTVVGTPEYKVTAVRIPKLDVDKFTGQGRRKAFHLCSARVEALRKLKPRHRQ